MLYAVTDRVVDDYLDVARRLDADVAAAESEIFDNRRHIDVRRLYQLKREIIEFKQAAVPLAHPVALLSEDGGPASLPGALRDLFRDVGDHLNRVTSQIAGYDELVGSLLQVNLAQVAVVQNSDMRKISAWAAIVAVPTLLAGHLRHELRAHAGADLAVRLPARLVDHGSRLPGPLPRLQAQQLALATPAVCQVTV